MFGLYLLLVVTMETFTVLSCNGNSINFVSKWFKMFQLVRTRFQCASKIVDLRHIEIINSISKLNKFSFCNNYRSFKWGGGNHIYFNYF